MTVVAWRGTDPASIERLALRSDPERIRAESTLEIGDERIRYSLELSPLWSFRSLLLRRGERELRLERSHCTWWLDGERRDDLAPAVDIDLAFSPSTNTLPIRRLRLPIGASAEIVTAYVSPELSVQPDGQRYTRLDARRYRYEAQGGGFEREIEVDGEGLVVDYPGLFARA